MVDCIAPEVAETLVGASAAVAAVTKPAGGATRASAAPTPRRAPSVRRRTRDLDTFICLPLTGKSLSLPGTSLPGLGARISRPASFVKVLAFFFSRSAQPGSPGHE